MSVQAVWDTISYLGGLIFGVVLLLGLLIATMAALFGKHIDKKKLLLKRFRDMEVYERQFDESE